MKKLVLIVMGSDSDYPVMEKAVVQLAEFGVGCDVRVCSAHRTPAVAHELASGARQNGYRVVIAAAGMAAHLAGVFAASTTLPVIGVPIASGAMNGVDALYSTVQMPPGIPVATVGIGGSKNAALLAVEMLSIADEGLAEQLNDFKASMAEAVIAKDQKLQGELPTE